MFATLQGIAQLSYLGKPKPEVKTDAPGASMLLVAVVGPLILDRAPEGHFEPDTPIRRVALCGYV